MASLANFIRHTPATTLRNYFDRNAVELPAVDWAATEPKIITSVLAAIDALVKRDRERVENDIDRVAAIADELGQVALYRVAPDRVELDELRNANDRALWMVVHERDVFRHAEEVRFTDDRRRGRMWDGFVCAPGLTVRRDRVSLETFKHDLRRCLETENVHIDVFDRHRTAFDGEDFEIVQVTVYSEGPTDDFLEFDDGELVLRPRRPVIEAALTYEPAPRVIEVVAKDREKREALARIFARDLLESEFRQERIPLRQYDLSILTRPFDFPTDPADGIETVRVNLLRLMPIDRASERVTLECTRQSGDTIWNMARGHFRDANPLNRGWVVTQAKLTIKFHPGVASRRGRTLPVTITMPHGCDLKDRTQPERVVGNKYLREWGILRDI